MNKLRFTVSCVNHNTLQKFCDKIIQAARMSGAVKIGPVCFKHKKLIDIHHANNRTFQFLMKIPKVKGVEVSIESLEN